MTLDTRWKSGRHIGPAKPTQRVRIRRGVMDRLYQPFTKLGGGGMGDFGFIQDSKHNAEPWQGQWRNTGDWIELPNVSSVEIEQSMDESGIATATIVIENVIAQAYAGLAGTYHAIKRGYLSPFLGFAVVDRIRRRADWSNQANEWLNVLNGGYRVLVEQGYGDAMDKSFTGLIDDCDIDVNPDTITLTCRDFGQMLTDQRLFGWNKAREITPPVTFQDRLKADNTKPVALWAKASDAMKGHPADAVLQKGTKRQWISDGSDSASVTRYVEIALPKGRYTSYFLYIWGAGASEYVSLNVQGATVDGVAVPDGWLDRGMGDVPGDNGGVPYVVYNARTSHGGLVRQLGFELTCDQAVLRISFRNIPYWPVTGDHRIGVARLAGYLRKRSKEAKQKHWILVDDANDVVKWVYMWAGFHEWEVESAGVRLAKPITFHQSDFLIAIIDFMKSQGQFVSFMKPPSANDDSIGVPVFRYTRILSPAEPIFEVSDRDILTDAQPKWTKENLSYIIRTRGRQMKSGESGGTVLGEDRTKRVQAVYMPPWSGAHSNVVTGLYDHTTLGLTDRLAGLRKHRVIEDSNVKNEEEALYMCVLAAIGEALASYTMTLELPGNPHITLDESLGVIDQPSGVNSKLWTASLHSTFTAGTNEWKVSIGGSLVDNPDMSQLVIDYFGAKAAVGGTP